MVLLSRELGHFLYLCDRSFRRRKFGVHAPYNTAKETKLLKRRLDRFKKRKPRSTARTVIDSRVSRNDDVSHDVREWDPDGLYMSKCASMRDFLSYDGGTHS